MRRVITLDNIEYQQDKYSIIRKKRVLGSNSKNKYVLLDELGVQLSNDEWITIPEGFVWDGSSVPRIFWWLLPPDGDFELGALIHDYLYSKKKELKYSRAFADREMLTWSRACSGTRKWSLRNIDNYTRYFAVRLFGWIVWKDLIKIK